MTLDSSTFVPVWRPLVGALLNADSLCVLTVFECPDVINKQFPRQVQYLFFFSSLAQMTSKRKPSKTILFIVHSTALFHLETVLIS